MARSCISLNRLQKGKLAETIAAAALLSQGFEVYAPLVDDHGVDFLVKRPDSKNYYEIQVKGTTKDSPVNIPQDKTSPLPENRLLCLVRLEADFHPDIYLIPYSVWDSPNQAFVKRDYDKLELSSAPEYGINFSRRNKPFFDPYEIDVFAAQMT